MRLAVFDTNVLVSAAIKPGSPPAQLVMDWVIEGQVQLVTSPHLVHEYRTVFARAKFLRYRFPPYWLEFLIEESMALAEPAPWPLAVPDPADAPFLALAHASGAWIVTGNLRHFPSQVRSGVRVLSPADYLATLEA